MDEARGLARRWVAAVVIAAFGVTAAFMATKSEATTSDTTTSATTTAGTTTTTPTTTQSSPPPKSTSPPAIGGTSQEGSTLTASTGSWVSTEPVAFAYQWRRCDSKGDSCSDISGATAQNYSLKTVDVGNTLRIAVTASGKGGSTVASSPPTAVIAALPKQASTGCSSVKAGQVVDVSQVSPPARLQVATFQPSPARLTATMQTFTLRVVVDDTCGHPVKGVLVYATAVPYEQVTIPQEQTTGGDGSVTLTFSRSHRFPASSRQQLLALFIRARSPGRDVLAGISTRRLVSIPVSLRG